MDSICHSRDSKVTSTALPWHSTQWSLVRKQLANDRRPHAMLLTGPADLGKREFATKLAAFLLCSQRSDHEQCNNCAQCHLLQAGTHPDYRHVELEDSKFIRIEQIRDLNGWLVQTSQQGGEKIAVIYPAEKMNNQSANALLKSLEEPTPNTLFILVSDQPSRLLPTIRSRCQSFQFSPPDETVAISWLEHNAEVHLDLHQALSLAGGSPLKVKRDIDDDFLNRRSEVVSMLDNLVAHKIPALAAAAGVQKQDPREVIQILLSLINDATKMHLGAEAESIINKDHMEVVRHLAERGETFLFGACDQVLAAIREIESSANPNPQLLIESILIKLTV